MSLPRRIKAILCGVTAMIQLPVLMTAAAEPIRSFKNDEMKIALTFDDGPHSQYTDEILEILDEYGIKATFFVIGCNCAENPEIVKRISEKGHEIGNHTYSHPLNAKLSPDRLKDEICRTEQIITELTGKKPELFRPPGGIYCELTSHTLDELDYIPILWTVDTKDWKRLPAASIAQTVMKDTLPGSIILCHDYVSGKSSTPEALRKFIPELIDAGYVFVTVSELIGRQTD